MNITFDRQEFSQYTDWKLLEDHRHPNYNNDLDYNSREEYVKKLEPWELTCLLGEYMAEMLQSI